AVSESIHQESWQAKEGVSITIAAEHVAQITFQSYFRLSKKLTATETEVAHVRLFRDHPQLRWKYHVHEQILPGVKQLGCDIRWTEFTGGLTSRRSQVGYQAPALRARKLQRDLRLLQLDDTEQPDDRHRRQVRDELARWLKEWSE